MIAGQMIQNLTGQREVIDGGRIDGTNLRRIFDVLPNTTYTGEAVPEWVWGCPSLHRMVQTGRVKCFNREPEPVVEEVPVKVAAPSAEVLALTAQVAALTALVEQLVVERKMSAEPAPIPGGRVPKKE